MRFSVKTEYGVRALLYLAANQVMKQGVPVREIARSEDIPPRFLEQQVTALKKAGIVQSQRGPSGGCRLARDAADITMGEVFEALEGPLGGPPPSEEESSSASVLAVHGLFDLASERMRDALSEVSLKDLLDRQQALAEARGSMFYI